ncbi:hypothetical protein PV379_05860 [Streptomyces caniscabiei]|uniref:hypothetical protein n=1 Tax=Streptomyces caniscabiei TaxID=2746961 RepID=UPI0029ADE18A|nr:hypothetical protein [Streptomyces caniscabiei]MDX2606192.1 hypothetical protein [Streptomyces caniscabiei]MDX2741508.1 hypothetical protein [Streptomyces caniscabiei]MDX2776854.1 hypothetical protein [Streptomyces caniscabiei]
MTKTRERAEGTSPLVYQGRLSLSARTVNHLASLLRRHLKAIRSRWRVLPPGRIAVIVLALLRHDQRLAAMAGGKKRVPRKPLRVFMQGGHRDLNWNEPQWNWLAENLRVAAALAEAGYDFRLVLGDGGHSPDHGGVLLPDALRWLWRPDDSPCRSSSHRARAK